MPLKSNESSVVGLKVYAKVVLRSKEFFVAILGRAETNSKMRAGLELLPGSVLNMGIKGV